ncbi:MAG: EAL domain-containing protein [Sulfurimonadaceae bacterium]|nr:EAL domain-containing protein [Sulfurimonadaceae bacterium]
MAFFRYCGALLFFILLNVTVLEAAGNCKNVFVLHSYHQEYPWTKKQHEGFVSVVNVSQIFNLHVATEYLNTKVNAFDEAYREFFLDYLQKKYAEFHPSLIYVTDDNALRFVMQYRSQFFPEAKVVFSGVNDVATAESLAAADYTGVIEKKSVIPNLELLKIFNSRLEEVVFVGDASNTYEAIETELRKTFETYHGITPRFVKAEKIDDVVKQLKALPASYVILTTIGHFRSSHDESMMLDQSIRMLAGAGEHKIFTMEDAYMLPGVIGGYVTSARKQGEYAGRMVKAFFEGVAVADIPVVKVSPNEYVFDRQELKRARLFLPAEIQHNAEIVNEDIGFYEANRNLILNTIALLTFLTLLALLYIVMMTRRQKLIVEAHTEELEQKAKDLEDAKSSLTHAQKIAHLGNWEWDLREGYVKLSDEAYTILDLPQNSRQLSFKRLLGMVHPDDREKVSETFGLVVRRQHTLDTDFTILTPKENEKIIHVCAQRYTGSAESPSCLIGTIQDITEQKQAEQRLEHLANYDLLTNLPNRNLFMQHLQQAMLRVKRNQSQLAMLFMDLDNFKVINDTMGHDIGDLLLVNVSDRLVKQMRESDIVVRMGGDEFIILLEGIKDPLEVAVICEKIIELFNEPFVLQGHELFVTTSIGVSVCPDDGSDAQTLIKHADTAMYHSKEQGKNSFRFFTQEMNERALSRLIIENNLRQAIEKEEFELFYQPQVDLASGNIMGAEVLLRWKLQGIGYVAPSDFITVAEETNLIIPVGEWVLETVFAHMARWKKEGCEAVRIAVNVSSRQLVRGDLHHTISRLSERYGIEARWIVIELTEGTLMDISETVLEQLNQLRNMGIEIAIDDFGTGYSSLSYLKKLPVNKLKIDRSFVMDLEDDTDDRALTRTIITMAASLNLEVVAEGVESEYQREFLLEEGCEYAQGYFFSKPVPVEEFEALLDGGKPLPSGDR